MPKETFWPDTAVEKDGSYPALVVEWHKQNPGVFINGTEFDRSGLNRLIRTLRKAGEQTFGADE